MTFARRGSRTPSHTRAKPDTLNAYWALDPAEALRRLRSEPTGLSSAEAARRLGQYGPNVLREQGQLSRARVLWSQLRSPLLLLLVFAAGASVLTGAWIDAAIVLTILVASVGIGVERPRRWDMRFIGRFMVVFGILSSFFDLLTFGALLRLFDATPQLFRTGWFVESLLTELVIALVVRTRRPFFRSRPGTLLWASTAAMIAVTFAIPFLPLAGMLGFTALPGTLLMTMIGITVLYIGAVELAKASFYRGRP